MEQKGYCIATLHCCIYTHLDAIVEKTSLPFAKRILSITPPVPRRKGWSNDESCIFYIRFRTSEGIDEVREPMYEAIIIVSVMCMSLSKMVNMCHINSPYS